MTIVQVDLTLEPKEDETGDGVQPGLPGLAEAARVAEDILADETKTHGGLGWRVTRVQLVAAGTVLVSAADLRHVLDRVKQGRWLDYVPEGACAAALRAQLEGER
jgi:hypothetical protein